MIIIGSRSSQVASTVLAFSKSAQGTVQDGRMFEELSKAALGAAEYVRS